MREIVNALAFATRPRFVLEGDEAQRSRRPTPSAGALHPVETVLFDPRCDTKLFRYEPRDHTLDVLIVGDAKFLIKFQAVKREILPDAHGTAIVILGDRNIVKTVYDNPDSLLWRDGGALLQTLALVSTAFRLAFCPLGVLGSEVASALNVDGAVALGVAMVGRPSSGFAEQ